MPTYSYTCKDCGAEHDIVQAMTAPTLTECPSCGGHMRKMFNNVGVVFKGSGFYRTDSRSNGEKPKTSTETKADAKLANAPADKAKPAEQPSTAKPASPAPAPKAS